MNQIKTVVLLLLFVWYAIEDVRKKKISIPPIPGFMGIGIVFFVLFRSFPLLSMAGGVAVGAVIMLISRITKGSIGMGDGIILAVSGLYLGFEKNLFLFFVGIFYAALCSLGLILWKKKKGKEEIAFIPFLLAAYLSMLIGDYYS
ncbi:hypothetical protein FACS1894111_08360 [Clostridia bacterium]|nr:hypothetical protein FACS1894111_08360 [Clostridia bacterium]